MVGFFFEISVVNGRSEGRWCDSFLRSQLSMDDFPSAALVVGVVDEK